MSKAQNDAKPFSNGTSDATGHLETVQLLLKRKADPRAANKKGDASLSMAKDDAVRDAITAALAAPTGKSATEAAGKVLSEAQQPTIGPSLGPFANRGGDARCAEDSAGAEGSACALTSEIEAGISSVAGDRTSDAHPSDEALVSGPALATSEAKGGEGQGGAAARSERQNHVRKRGEGDAPGAGGAAGVGAPSKPSKRPVLSHLANDDEDDG